MDMAREEIITDEVILKNLIHHTPQYIFWKDKDSIFRGCNQTFAQLFGYDCPDDIIGLTNSDLVRDEDGFDARFFRSRDEEVITGKAIINFEQVIYAPNGRNITVLTNKTPIYNNDNEVIGVLAIALDITDKKQYEREIIKQKNSADLANRAKSEFITNMSHDIRTPLAGMIGMAEEISVSDLSVSAMKDYARKLANAGNKLLHLMNEILEMTLVEQGNFTTRDTSFSLLKLIEDIRDLMLPSLEKKALKFIMDYDNNIPQVLYGKYTLLHRVLLNLASNAIKFTTQGHIKISAHLLKKSHDKVILQLCVADTGIGIPKDQQQTIFHPFKQISPTGNKNGTGLGLYIVKQLARMLGSEIVVKSEDHKGSHFIFQITTKTVAKVAVNSETVARKQGVLDKTPTIPKGKALLVEDNALIRQVAVLKLQNLYSSVDVVSKGSEAILQFKESRYEIVYLDLGLPDILGYTVAEELRKFEKEKNLPRTLIVALTAHSVARVEKECIAKDIDVVLTKPLSLETAQRLRKSGVKTFKKEYDNVQLTEETISKKAINFDQAIKIAGSETLAREVIAILAKELSDIKQHLATALASQDWQQLTRLVHQMHGSAGCCGAQQLNDILAGLEEDLFCNRTTNVGTSYKKLVSAIDNFLAAQQQL